MIAANELRIGNYVSDIHSENGIWKIVSIGELTAKYGNYKSNVYSSKFENITPIPLTPEILYKCGFVKSKRVQGGFTIDGLEIDLDYITQDQDGYEFEYKFGLSDKWNIVHVKYLHQLQNIIHALTGKELNITL